MVPFRADHIGSLLRPKSCATRSASMSPGCPRRIARCAGRAIREVVQAAEGLRARSRDRRRIPPHLLLGEVRAPDQGPGGEGRGVHLPRCRGAGVRSSPRLMSAARCRAPSRSRWTSSGFGNNKVTMPAPSTMHFYRFTDWGGAYDSAEEFFADLGKVYQAEIADLAKAGCRYVQLDEVAVAILCDPAAREKVKGGRRPGSPGRSLHRRDQPGGEGAAEA